MASGSARPWVSTANRVMILWVFVTFDTDGEVIFAEASQVANQLVERAPSVGSGLFQTSPSVSLLVSRGGALLAGLPDHLGRLEEERRRKRQPKSLSGAEVEDELEVYGPLHREVGRFGALQNLVHMASGAPKQVRQARAIRQDPAGLDVLPHIEPRRQPAMGRQLRDPSALAQEHRVCKHDQRLGALSGHR